MFSASWQKVTAYFSQSGTETDGVFTDTADSTGQRLRGISHQQLNANTFQNSLSRIRLGGLPEYSIPGRAISSVHFSHSVMSNSLLSHEPQHPTSLSITNSWGPPKPMSIESGMPFNHLILCRLLLLLPSIFPSIREFSNESALRMR